MSGTIHLSNDYYQLIRILKKCRHSNRLEPHFPAPFLNSYVYVSNSMGASRAARGWRV